MRPVVWVGAVLTGVLIASCGEPDEPAGEPTEARYVLSSIVITPEGRTMYVQTLPSLDIEEHVTNEHAIEVAGNGVLLTHGRHIFLGLSESPEWVRYTVGEDGAIAETGRIHFGSYGLTAIGYGNAIIDPTSAVTVAAELQLAIVWSPETMTVRGTIPLPHLERGDYEEVEVWTTVAHDGRVYVPARWSDWTGARIRPGVVTAILDPQALSVVGVAEDARCTSGGRIVFDEDGYGYVMGDGRNWSAQLFASSRGEERPVNCLLRIAPGATDFDESWMVEIPSLTDGLESIGELDAASQGSGIAFTRVFYEGMLPEGTEPDLAFGFWQQPVYRTWRITLGETPTAEAVEGTPFSSMGFAGSSVDGLFYEGQSPDYSVSTVYEIDPDTNGAHAVFEMDGLFNGLARLGE
ncbi:hypothetical protein [Sandaracinus amylolyticus]|uniref:hypothetical protein n=1 Tax=Sandaracinus amylolyticus TaxID=927083 RepID=UPI001F24D292|nr:hypothetical protein [Sandaracinus amylolyticus]UJR82464.1 Hypothetical protein I5071_45290 [Sandaracinus amylolyticus]